MDAKWVIKGDKLLLGGTLPYKDTYVEIISELKNIIDKLDKTHKCGPIMITVSIFNSKILHSEWKQRVKTFIPFSDLSYLYHDKWIYKKQQDRFYYRLCVPIHTKIPKWDTSIEIKNDTIVNFATNSKVEMYEHLIKRNMPMDAENFRKLEL